MISRITGDIAFRDGLQLQAHARVPTDHVQGSRNLDVEAWTWFDLGIHESEHGAFEVTAVSGDECRIQLVLLSHSHSFYQSDTPGDRERRAFHEGVINADLGGQREFSWGRAYCRRDPSANKDALIVAYAAGPQVPERRDPVLGWLEAEEAEPDTAGYESQSAFPRE